MKTSMSVKNIEDRIAVLSDVARQEVMDFIDFLAIRQSRTESGLDKADDAAFWQVAGTESLERIWSNMEDDVYAQLLDR